MYNLYYNTNTCYMNDPFEWCASTNNNENITSHSSVAMCTENRFSFQLIYSIFTSLFFQLYVRHTQCSFCGGDENDRPFFAVRVRRFFVVSIYHTIPSWWRQTHIHMANHSAIHIYIFVRIKRHQSRIITINIIAYRVSADAATVVRCAGSHTESIQPHDRTLW